ncbi:MAG: DedA family protein [Gammaproteobacteria bacterium]|nr:DedA family protein [Gammaproteobacteria bacterium]MDD9885727.1 DedA family protein [Gammaproteobacteria bacterium]
MRVFTRPYEMMMSWIGKRGAEKYLYGLTFCESVFFPVPTDVMLAPMCALNPPRTARLVILTTVFSALGGVFGYVIGLFLFDQIEPWLRGTAYWDEYGEAVELFGEWGIWIIFIAALTPIPYKLFTISAGVLGQNLLLFVLATLVGRGMRFGIVGYSMKWFGPALSGYIEKRIEIIGWVLVALLAAAILYRYL